MPSVLLPGHPSADPQKEHFDVIGMRNVQGTEGTKGTE